MKRDLFVFAGQSNMVGAGVFPPQKQLSIKNSYEYKHKPRRLGAPMGDFVVANYPVGEFSYVDLDKAYDIRNVNEKGESKLDDYAHTTYFSSSMSNLRSEKDKTLYPFSVFSEANAQHGATLAPFLAEEWEKLGGSCAYAHIAKGGVAIAYYLDEEMSKEYTRRMTEYNQANGTNYDTNLFCKCKIPGCAEYFVEKCNDFFTDAKKFFANEELGEKCFFWLQGEGDANTATIEYETKLDILWEKLKTIGFTHFFCIRVDYFGDNGVDNIMKAQENFVTRHPDAYMLTRAASYFTYVNQNDAERFLVPPIDDYKNCRDSFYGYDNHHINEKGFYVIAKRSVKNLYRVLIEKKAPVLEEENIRGFTQR